MWLLILSIITGTSIMVRQNQVCGPSLPGLVLPLLALLRVRHPPLLVSILFGADLVVFVRCVVGILPPECMAGGFWVRSASTTLTHSTPGASSWRRAVPTKVPYTTTPKAARTQGAVARRVLVDCATGQTLLVRALFFYRDPPRHTQDRFPCAYARHSPPHHSTARYPRPAARIRRLVPAPARWMGYRV